MIERFEFNKLVNTARSVTPAIGSLLLSRTTPEMVVAPPDRRERDPTP